MQNLNLTQLRNVRNSFAVAFIMLSYVTAAGLVINQGVDHWSGVALAASIACMLPVACGLLITQGNVRQREAELLARVQS